MLSSALSYTAQTCLPRDRAAHSGPWPPTSITNPDNPLTELPQKSLSCVQLKLKVTRICVFQSFHDSRETNWRQAGRQGQEVLTLRIQSSVKSAVIREGSRVEACGILERAEKLRRLSLPATVPFQPQAFLPERVKTLSVSVINSPEDGHVDMMGRRLISPVLFGHV